MIPRELANAEDGTHVFDICIFFNVERNNQFWVLRVCVCMYKKKKKNTLLKNA